MLSQPELEAPRPPRRGTRVGADEERSLVQALSQASTWESRARLARQARLTYAVEAMPLLVERLQQGNLRKRQIHETAGALLLSALISGLVVLMRLLLALCCIGAAGWMGYLLLVLCPRAFAASISPKLIGFSQAMALYIPVLAALAGIVYLSQGWAKLGCHLVVREMHRGTGLLKLGGLMLLVMLIILALPLRGLHNGLWEAILCGYVLTLFGCFLQGMLADYDGYLIEAEFGRHPDNLYRLAFAIHAHAAVDNITQLVRSEATRRLCKHCLVSMELISDQVINTQYYRCRSCYLIYDGVQVVADGIRVVAVIDTGWQEAECPEGEILFVNALRRPSAFYFDEVLIQQSSDAQVERFIMKMENDLDAVGWSRPRQVVCRVSSGVPLSAHTRNLLRHTFGEIQEV
jgi:hypothetical protein